MGTLRAGFGAAKITPGLDVSLAGYFEERLATAVHDDLYARALVLDDGQAQAGLLSCDLIGVSAAQVASIRNLVEAATELPAGSLLVCATHTHTGPRNQAREDTQGKNVTDEWIAAFPQRAAEAVIAAMADREPCSISGAYALEDRIAFNRRYRMKDGTVQTNPGRVSPTGAMTSTAIAGGTPPRDSGLVQSTIRNPNIIEPAGPIDPEVGVLAFTGADGRTRAIYVNYSCHLDCVGGTEISADYPGHMMRRLQDRVAGSPFVLFSNGAAGNVNHFDLRSPYHRQGHEHARWMGETLAGDVCQALGGLAPLSGEPVRAASEVIQLPMREGADRTAGRVEIQAISVGDVGFVGIPAEYFVEFQLDIKKRSPFKHTFISSLANGSVGYVPTRKAFEENIKDVPAESMKSFDQKGYEVRSALARGFLPGVGEVMADAAVWLLDQLALA
jgi:hypothetical protein